MKLIISESQNKRMVLIAEGANMMETFFQKADEIQEKVNRLYTTLTYSTLAELLEGDNDLSVILNTLEQYRTVMDTHYQRFNTYVRHMPDDVYSEKWEDIHLKVEDKYQAIVYHKIDALEELISMLKDFADSNVENNFKDIKKIDINLPD